MAAKNGSMQENKHIGHKQNLEDGCQAYHDKQPKEVT
jgi:hypothetical protein